MEIKIQTLSHEVSPEYGRMTSAAHRALLQGDVSAEVIAVGALAEGKPIGLGLARGSEVLSLFVTPPLWGGGIGSQLLRALESGLRHRGCREAVLRYTTQSPTTPALERILAKDRWSPPQTQLVLAQIRTAMVDEAPWVRRVAVHAPFALFPWASLAAEERRAMEAFRAEVPPALWPLAEETAPEPASSLGLRRGAEIAGWMVTHRVAATLTRFAMLYVRERWRTPALSFALVAEAGRRLRAAYGPEMLGALAVQAENALMLHVLERKFRPWAAVWSELRVATKKLAPG